MSAGKQPNKREREDDSPAYADVYALSFRKVAGEFGSDADNIFFSAEKEVQGYYSTMAAAEAAGVKLLHRSILEKPKYRYNLTKGPGTVWKTQKGLLMEGDCCYTYLRASVYDKTDPAAYRWWRMDLARMQARKQAKKRDDYYYDDDGDDDDEYYERVYDDKPQEVGEYFEASIEVIRACDKDDGRSTNELDEAKKMAVDRVSAARAALAKEERLLADLNHLMGRVKGDESKERKVEQEEASGEKDVKKEEARQAVREGKSRMNETPSQAAARADAALEAATSGHMPPPGASSDSKVRTKRVPFSEEECNHVLEGYDKYQAGNSQIWMRILHAYPFHPTRTSVDIKDKHRNLMKKQKQN
tara:strand:+ start:157 stop:1233 length:1077 start_codon:yes stop_codon:yes gene_type:complete